MLLKQASGLLATLFAIGASARCSSDLQINNFTNFSAGVNSLNSPASDDGSMGSISATRNVLSFNPKDQMSYYYETFPCQKARTEGYNGIQFAITYPAGMAFTLEIQSKSNCNDTSFARQWFEIAGLAGTSQIVTLDLGVYTEANLDAITAFVFATFTKTGAYTLSDLRFVCIDFNSAKRSPELPKQSLIKPRGPGARSPPSLNQTPATVISRKSKHVTNHRSNGQNKYTGPEIQYTAGQPIAPAVTLTPIIYTRGPAVERRADPGYPATTIRAVTQEPQPTQNAVAQPNAEVACSALLIDDWESQSRLTFLYYNSQVKPTSDDGTMKSVVVSNDNTVTLTPNDSNSYFYSQFGCVNTVGVYGGISMKINAPSGSSFSIAVGSLSKCPDGSLEEETVTTRSLGWEFTGKEASYSFPFSKFKNIDPKTVSQILIKGLSKPTTIGPMSLYCGTEASWYPAPPAKVNPSTETTVSAPAGRAGTFVIDKFDNEQVNALDQWHGCEEDCLVAKWVKNGGVTLNTNDADLAWYTNLADTCADISTWKDSYMHIQYSGSNKFTVSLRQSNDACNPDVAPYPETWDSIEAARYASATDIYIPMSHFKVDLHRVTTVAFKGFYTTASTTFKRLEIVDSVPSGFKIPNKLASGNLVFACKRPNSFALAIDDGDPALAQEVMEIVRSENVKVTFFTVGLPLEDGGTNLSTVYRDMQSRGHQIALHSFTHPKMEGLADYAAIDWEYNNDIGAVKKAFGTGNNNNGPTPYFRPPFGTEGARMRQRLAIATGSENPYVTMWSVDVEDWLWAGTSTPEKQLAAFKRDLARGGSLTVLHYLYPDTVKYLRQFIQLAKASGKQMMRVDQCMMDPNAPKL